MDKSVRRYLKDAFYADQANSLLCRIIEARAGALGREHDEALHDWRVLCRRLIEFTKMWARRPLRKAVLPIAEPWIDATNAARDAEVELAMIATLKKSASSRDAVDLACIEAAVAPAVREHNAALEAFLRDPARKDEERRLQAQLAQLPRFPRVPGRLPGRLRRAIDRFRDMDKRRLASDKERHRFRLATKCVRYGFEPLAPLHPEVKRVLKELTALQRALGEYRDWTRLAEKARSLGLGDSLVRVMTRKAAKHLASRPGQMRVTEKFLAAGWAAPPLPARVLRDRLAALPESGQPPLSEAMNFLSKLKNRKQSGPVALAHPYRTALVLQGEGDPRALAAALIAGAMAGWTPVSEDQLGKRFDAETVGGLMALDPGEEPPEEHRARLLAAPPWARRVALALELEKIRTLLEADRPVTEIDAAAARLRALLPLFHDHDALVRQARRILEIMVPNH